MLQFEWREVGSVEGHNNRGSKASVGWREWKERDCQLVSPKIMIVPSRLQYSCDCRGSRVSGHISEQFCENNVLVDSFIKRHSRQGERREFAWCRHWQSWERAREIGGDGRCAPVTASDTAGRDSRSKLVLFKSFNCPDQSS